jgi:hypothetical protein
MKVHADVGADILKSIDFPYPVEPIVRHHHEKWDGSGYPQGLREQQIPLGARILAVVDCYDALTSDRPYRPRMTRQQAEQELKDKRGTAYDPWVVDNFIRILDKLEEAEAAERRNGASGVLGPGAYLAPEQLDVIAATTAEEREFNELRRDLSRAHNWPTAGDMIFAHMRRLLPMVALAIYVPRPNSNEIVAVASCGTGASRIEGLGVPIGERISGWVFAHSQAVINSDPTLELGPIARTFPVPLRYTAALPIADRRTLGVIVAFGNEPFEKDHRRLLENAATLCVTSLNSTLFGAAEGHTRPSTIPFARTR